jgi:hypothetical protein
MPERAELPHRYDTRTRARAAFTTRSLVLNFDAKSAAGRNDVQVEFSGCAGRAPVATLHRRIH